MYFDLHLHPSSKPFLTGPALGPKKFDCWATLNNILMDIIGSQSSLDQLVNGNVQVAVSCLYALESPFTYNFILEHIVPVVTFVEPEAMVFPSNDKPFERLLAELKLLKASSRQDKKAIHFIGNYKDIKPNQLNLILAVEGAHSLGIGENDILKNFEALKKSSNRLLYLTLTHLTRADCASHAYSIKLIKKSDQFKPAGGGLYPLGEKVIDLAYDESIGGHRVFIDIKHMSLETRKNFYAYRKSKGYESIPIIASHIACTGISWQNIKKYIQSDKIRTFDISSDKSPDNQYAAVFYKQVAGLSNTSFNPISANLYDEDIRQIIQSGGLIGLVLEKKMLGLQKKASEFFELAEYNKALGKEGERSNRDNEDFEEDLEKEADEKREKIEDARKRAFYWIHLNHIANQILHIVKIGGAEAWNHICIGSDFDGLISSADCCEDAKEYHIMTEDLPRALKELIDENPGVNYHANNLVAQVGKIMYGNAMGFLAKWFKERTQPPIT